LIGSDSQVIERNDVIFVRGNIGERQYYIRMREINCSFRVQCVDVRSDQDLEILGR
jgi:hypothetical protein